MVDKGSKLGYVWTFEAFWRSVHDGNLSAYKDDIRLPLDHRFVQDLHLTERIISEMQ